MIKNFRTYYLAMEFYNEALKVNLTRYEKDQFHRASLSILLNLAEGWGRMSRNDRRKFFYIAFGSLRECEAIINIRNISNLKAKIDILAAHLYKLCKNI